MIMPPSLHKKIVAVSGAGGLIGRAVIALFLARGYSIRALAHSPDSIDTDDPALRWIVGDICDPNTASRLVDGAEILVHLAARKSDERDSEKVNICGTQNLLDACRAAGVRGIINVSTISTKLSTAGVYGKTKRAADRIIAACPLPSRTLLLSVVYDDSGSGIFGVIMRYARLPAIPVIGSGDVTFRPIHVDDVAKAIELLAEAPMAGHRTYELGGPDRISFNALALMIGEKVRGAKPRLVHLPHWFAKLLAGSLPLFFSRPPITMSNVLGMGEELDVDSSAFLREFDLHPRTLSSGIAKLREPAPRARSSVDDAAAEASRVLGYVSGRAPKEGSITAYKSAVAHFGLTEHRISPMILASTILLGAFDAATKLLKPRGAFQRKMLIASALYECTPGSSEKLLPREHGAGALIFSAIMSVVRSGGKLALGLMLVCIPGIYERNA